MVDFGGTSDTGLVERKISRWKKIVSRFRGNLVKMIKYGGSKFDDY